MISTLDEIRRLDLLWRTRLRWVLVIAGLIQCASVAASIWRGNPAPWDAVDALHWFVHGFAAAGILGAGSFLWHQSRRNP